MKRNPRRINEFFYDPVSRKFVRRAKYYRDRNKVGGVPAALSDPDDSHVAPSTSSQSSFVFSTIDDDIPSVEATNSYISDDVKPMIEDDTSTRPSVGDEELDNVDSINTLPSIGDIDEMDNDDSAYPSDEEEVGRFRLFDDEDEEYDENEARDDGDVGDEEDSNDISSIERFHRELGSWLIRSKCRQRNSKSLLNLLRNADKNSILFSSLPKHPSTLYRKKPTDVVYEEIQPGESAYIGVRQSLELSELFYDKKKDIDLVTHVDGLPLFQTSGVQFWPILGSCNRRPIFIISLYKGLRKPDQCKAFLKRFIDEILPYFKNGIQIHDKTFKFHLTCILADAPARAFLLNMKYHSGYFSCSKCPIKGRYCDGRVCFPPEGNEKLPRRLPGKDFYKGTTDEGQAECPLHRIPIEHFNIVDDVLLDSMHLIYLGVMKKLIETWTAGVTVKRERKMVRLCSRLISASNIQLVNDRLRQMNQFYPSEFQRAPRPFSEIAYWRAHEYRQFLLYLGYGVLHDILSEDHLSHFLTLQLYCRILADASKVEDKGMIEFTEKLAELFITQACELFGEHWVIYNIHGLLHIPEDVYKFGCLESTSCFLFESFMYVLKHLVRSGRYPLRQAINRWLEWVSVQQHKNEEGDYKLRLSHVYHDDSNIIDDKDYDKFKQLHLRNFVLRGDRHGDSCCLLDDNFIEIQFFARSKNTGKIFAVGKKYISAKPLYDDPIDSNLVGVYKCKRLNEDAQIFPISEETIRKIYRFPLFGTADTFVCNILLHSMERE